MERNDIENDFKYYVSVACIRTMSLVQTM